MTTLRQRAEEAHFPYDLLAAVLAVTPNDPAFDRALDKELVPAVRPLAGGLAQRIVDVLDEAERTGTLPDVPLEAWQRQARELDPTTAEGQAAARQAEAERQRLWLAERDAEDQARRDEVQARIKAASEARTQLALELADLRITAGLSLSEMASLIGNITVAQLSRLENGIPVGFRDVQRVLDGYRRAARLPRPSKVSPGQGKVHGVTG